MVLSIILLIAPLFSGGLFRSIGKIKQYTEVHFIFHQGRNKFHVQGDFDGTTFANLNIDGEPEYTRMTEGAGSSSNSGSNCCAGTRKTLDTKFSKWTREMQQELSIFDAQLQKFSRPNENDDALKRLLEALDIDKIGPIKIDENRNQADPIEHMVKAANDFRRLYGSDNVIAQLGVHLYTMDSEKGGPWRFVNNEHRKDAASYEGFYGSLGFIIDGFINLGMTDYHAKPDFYYRGMKHIEMEDIAWFQSMTGQQIIFPAFISASLNKNVARAFQRERIQEDEEPGLNSVLFEIEYKPGQKGFERSCFGEAQRTFAVNIKAFSQFPEEEETLFAPYHIFIVDEVSTHKASKKKGRATIGLTCVGVSWPEEFYHRALSKVPQPKKALGQTPEAKFDEGMPSWTGTAATPTRRSK